MNKNYKTLFFITLFFTPVHFSSAAELPGIGQLFKQKCSLCHATDKKTLGPAINTMSNEKKVLLQAIIKGKNSMPAYEGKLTGAEIDALADYLLANQ